MCLPCERKLIQTNKPCARCGTSERFSPFLCVGFPTRRQCTLKKPHTLSPFLSGSQPPPTNVQLYPVIRSSLNNPVYAVKSLSLRKLGQQEREDVLRQTINQECMATWEKSEFRNELLRNSQLPSIPARHWSGTAEEKHGQTFSWSRELEAYGGSAHG